MKLNPRIIEITNIRQACAELEKLNCDRTGVDIMAPKATFRTIKLEKVSAKEANLLKQTFLAKGGEVAVARGTANLSVEYTDILICATLKQYRMALAQLNLQPWGLPQIAKVIEQIINFTETDLRREYVWSDRKLSIRSDRTLIMGILNVTPDSFADGGKYNSADLALKHVEEMIRCGADIIDIGAESTRPYQGAEKIPIDEEMERLLPILEKVLAVSTVPVSVDTYKARVAEEALKMGAHIINDVWGLQQDAEMAKVVASYNVPVIVMHNQEGTGYERDIMAHICGFLRQSIDLALTAGIEFSNLIVDPGIGFGKTPEQNLIVMSKLKELQSLGCPVLLGTSRKRFIGEVLDLPVQDRVEGTAATVAMGIMKGVNIVRVHDVKTMARVAKMTDKMIRGGL